MNRPIRRVAVLAAVMFAALLINASWLEVGRANTLNQDTRNRRVTDAEFSRNRGAILVGNQAIALSNPSAGVFAYQRHYTQPQLYSHVTGYFSYNYGSQGIELNHSKELAGTSDSQFFTRLVDSLTGKPPAGASVVTTLDPRAQRAAYDALAGRKGAVVALNWKTGAVLSYVSLPSYDPNGLASTDFATSKAAWDRLLADPDKPLANRASRELYPPGSTFKLVTAAAALENGATPETLYDAPASLRLPLSSSRLTNQLDCGGDRITIEQALKTSCNTAFANMGLQVGGDALRTQAQKFGFDQNPPGDVPWVASRFPDQLNEPQTALSAIGQYDVRATPLQMAMIVGAIANDGQVMNPYLVSEVRATDLQTITTYRPQRLQRALSRDNARVLQNALVATVNEGTGQAARIDGVRVGGKTGTAQSSPDRPPYAWFVAYSEDPDVAVAVFIEEARVERSDIAGGRLAGPVARAVIEALR